MVLLPESHYFDVFPCFGIFLLDAGTVEETLCLENYFFRVCHRSISYRGGGVVCTEIASFPFENVRQRLRPMRELDLVLYVPVWINEPEVLFEPLLCCTNGDLFDGNWFSVHVERSSVSEYQKHWAYDLASGELSSDLSSCQECFVDIVVEYCPVALEIFL